MDEFEDRYEETIEAGKRNARATQLLANWCFHAEFARSPGRGLIEAETGLPIGHMGVQCKFSKSSSMFCWLLEDAAYDFYQNNCKSCDERVPVGLPNIMEFVAPREAAAEKRRENRRAEEREQELKRVARRQERADLRAELSMDELFVVDLLDELDNDDVASNDPRLEQLASLAPETFTRRIIDHLLPGVLNEHLPYSDSAGKALIKAAIEDEEKVAIAVRLISGYERSQELIDVILSNTNNLSKEDLRKVVPRFVHMALGPPPGAHIGGGRTIRLTAAPIQSLYQHRHADIRLLVNELMKEGNAYEIRMAVEIILATDCEDLLEEHRKGILAKLMRRSTLLPGEKQDSDVIYYVREAASKSLEKFPSETDGVIQSFLADNSEVGRVEANKVYRSMFKHDHRAEAGVGTPQRIAFRRLLWAAVDNPDDFRNDAAQFFMHSSSGYAQLASDFSQDLVGAAATLTAKYDQVDVDSTLQISETVLSEMEKRNKRTAIDRLQEALVEWVALGSKSEGAAGIEAYLELYRKLPDEQSQMRAKMVMHFSKLLTGVDSLSLVMSDWYRALMDESVVVRASAASAWATVPTNLVKNFPSLFFQSYSVLLLDPYVIVHRSAVHALSRRSFPKRQRYLIKQGLWNLIVYYAKENNQDDFVVECVDVFAFSCLSLKERESDTGKLLSTILLGAEGSALYQAVNRLHYGFTSVPGYASVAFKSIQDEFTRSVSIEDCISTILKAPRRELEACIDDAKRALGALSPFSGEKFHESLLYAAVLTRVGAYDGVSASFSGFAASIPKERRYNELRLRTTAIATVSEFEKRLKSGEDTDKLVAAFKKILSDLEVENEERAKLRDFPRRFFFQD